MKERAEVAERVKAMRVRLAMDQVRFAEFLGVTQARISQWESGKGEPSAEMYLRLASHGSPQETIWFLHRAGMDRSALERAAGDFIADRSVAHLTGEAVRVPRMRLVNHKLDESGARVVLPRECVANPAATVCIESVPSGTLLIVDTSETDIAQVLGGNVAVDSSLPRPWDQGLKRSAGLVAGQLDLVREAREEGIYWYATLNADNPEETRIAFWVCPYPKNWKRGAYQDFIVESASTRRQPFGVRSKQVTRYAPAPPPDDWDAFIRQSMREAPDQLKVFEGYRILGRWLGWIGGRRASLRETLRATSGR